MDLHVNEVPQSELSFLTPPQTEVFSTLGRLFPDVGKDILIVTLTSPEIYHDGIDKLVLLNRCIDEFEVHNQVIDLTERLAAPEDKAIVASTSKPINHNDTIKVPSSGGDNLIKAVAVDALPGTSSSDIKVVGGKEKTTETVIVVHDADEDSKDSGTDLVVKKESLVGNGVGSSESTVLDENNFLDDVSDSDSLPEVILLPDDNEITISTHEIKNRMNEAGSSGRPNTFQNKNLEDVEAPKDPSLPWRKCQEDHTHTTEVTEDVKLTNSKNLLDSTSRKEDVSRTSGHQQQDFDSQPSSGITLTPVHSFKLEDPEVGAHPRTSLKYPIPKVTKDKGITRLESHNESGCSTTKQLSGVSNMTSFVGLQSSRGCKLPSGSNSASSAVCRIHRGIKPCECKSRITSPKSTHNEMLSKKSKQNGPSTPKGVDFEKSHTQSFPIKRKVASNPTTKHSSEKPKHSRKDLLGGSSSADISTGAEQVTTKVQFREPQHDTQQRSGSSLPQRIQIPGGTVSSQAEGHDQGSSQKSEVAVSTPQTNKQASASPSVVKRVIGYLHVVKTANGEHVVAKRVGNTLQQCSNLTVNNTLTLTRALNNVINPQKLQSAEGTTHLARQAGHRNSQEVSQTAGTPLVRQNPVGTFGVGQTSAGASPSTSHSSLTAQTSQNKMGIPIVAQSGLQSSLALPIRISQVGIVGKPLARPQPPKTQEVQSKGFKTSGKSLTGRNSSPAPQARQLHGRIGLDPTIRAGPSGVQPTRPQSDNVSQLSKAINQPRNNGNAPKQNVAGPSQANRIPFGNTQTVIMAERVLGNVAFLPRNVVLNQGQRQTDARPQNGFPLPQQIAPRAVFQNGIAAGVPIRQGTCQVHGDVLCNCPALNQDRDIFEVPEQAAVDVSPFMAQVFNLFPDADPDFVRQKLQTAAQSVPDPVQWVCNLMLEDSYPRKQVPAQPKTPPPSTSKPQEFDYINKWRELPLMENRSQYIAEARRVLAFAFKLISMSSIDEVMRSVSFRFTPAFVVLEKIVHSKEYIKAGKSHQPPVAHHHNNACFFISCELPGEKLGLPNGKKFEEKKFKIKLNRKPRTNMMPCANKELKKEMEYYKNFVKEKQEEEDHQMALHVNQEEYEQNQQGIECECCFVEHPFENMVQCFEMHLFCSDCLQRYVKEAIFGQGKGNLACMATDCSSTFPRDQIEKTLPTELLAKYDERCREESVHLADLEDLVRCPHCQFAATLALEIKAFLCPQCGKETCRNCQQDWKEHFGKKCEELESRSEEQLRTKYEEKLTEALIRTCHRCKASIVKENGCNKMTCRCGARMCYICRKPNIDYNHFCQHVRDPSKKGCNKCNACCLWEVAEVIDEKKMEEIKDEMKAEQEGKGIDERKRQVGVPESIGGGSSKKPRTQ